jgi:hypothetical protein
MSRIIGRTVCTAGRTTESRSAISHTLHNDMEKRNPCLQVDVDAGVDFFSGVQDIICQGQ